MSKVAEIEAAEKDKMKHKCEKIIGHGINCFINRQLIYNYPEQIFAAAGVAAIEHADFDGVERLALVTGGEIVSTFDNPNEVKLGECDLIEEIMIGEDKMIKFSGVKKGEACTIVLRGASSHLLGEAERASLARTRNKPLHACNLIAQQIGSVDETPLDPTGRTLTFSSRERLAMLSQVADLSDCIGACERIVQTPVPLHYARHTSRLATLFVFTLPLVLTAEMGLLTVPCMAIICWALFGIQEIGLIIEEPFGKMLELDSICKSIQSDIRETLPWVGSSLTVDGKRGDVAAAASAAADFAAAGGGVTHDDAKAREEAAKAAWLAKREAKAGVVSRRI